MGAINEDEEVAASLGVRINAYKIVSAAIPAAMLGITGWFFAHSFRTFAGTTYLPLDVMLKILLITMIGGRASIYGSVLGAYFVTLIEDFLRQFGQINYVLFPLTLLLCLLFLSEGLWGLYRKRKYREYYPAIRIRRR
jgi:branched-chain amino acid transport system permease protein